MFSVVNATLYGARRAFIAPDRTFFVDVARRARGGRSIQGLSYTEYQSLASRSKTFERLTAESQREVPIEFGGIASSTTVSYVTADLFRMTRNGAQSGRYPSAETEWSGFTPSAVVSVRLAESFGVPPAGIIGKTLTVAGKGFIIVAVAPPSFQGTGVSRVEAWLSLASAGDAQFGPNWQINPGATFFRLLGRIAAGATPAQAEREIARLLQPDLKDADRVQIESTRLISVGDPDYSFGRRDKLMPFVVLGLGSSVFAVSVGSVLLLCWTLTLSMAAELSIRRAIGAPTGALVRLVIVRLWLICLIGCVIGIGATAAIARIAETTGLVSASVTPTALAITFGLSLLTGLLCTSPVALVARLARATSGFRSGERVGTNRPRARVSRALVTAQVSMSFVLGVLTVLLALSLRTLVSLNPGFDAQRVIAVDVTGGPSEHASDLEAVLVPLMDRLRQRPDVEAVALALTHPFGSSVGRMFSIPGADTAGTSDVRPTTNAVEADYFRALGVRIERGRPLAASDVHGSERVAVISRSLERRYFRGEDAIGRCVRTTDAPDICTRIVGVTADMIQHDIGEHDVPRLLVPLPQFQNGVPIRTLVIRARDADGRTIQSIREAVRGWHGSTSIATVALGDQLRAQVAPWRRFAALIGLFGSLALVVSLFGVYGLSAARVRERWAEFGLRAALGAPPRAIAWIVVRESAMLAGVGILAGAAVTIGLLPRFAALLVTTTSETVGAFILVALTILFGVCIVVVDKAIEAARASPSMQLYGN